MHNFFAFAWQLQHQTTHQYIFNIMYYAKWDFDFTNTTGPWPMPSCQLRVCLRIYRAQSTGHWPSSVYSALVLRCEIDIAGLTAKCIYVHRKLQIANCDCDASLTNLNLTTLEKFIVELELSSILNFILDRFRARCFSWLWPATHTEHEQMNRLRSRTKDAVCAK